MPCLFKQCSQEGTYLLKGFCDVVCCETHATKIEDLLKEKFNANLIGVNGEEKKRKSPEESEIEEGDVVFTTKKIKGDIQESEIAEPAISNLISVIVVLIEREMEDYHLGPFDILHITQTSKLFQQRLFKENQPGYMYYYANFSWRFGDETITMSSNYLPEMIAIIDLKKRYRLERKFIAVTDPYMDFGRLSSKLVEKSILSERKLRKFQIVFCYFLSKIPESAIVTILSDKFSQIRQSAVLNIFILEVLLERKFPVAKFDFSVEIFRSFAHAPRIFYLNILPLLSDQNRIEWTEFLTGNIKDDLRAGWGRIASKIFLEFEFLQRMDAYINISPMSTSVEIYTHNRASTLQNFRILLHQWLEQTQGKTDFDLSKEQNRPMYFKKLCYVIMIFVKTGLSGALSYLKSLSSDQNASKFFERFISYPDFFYCICLCLPSVATIFPKDVRKHLLVCVETEVIWSFNRLVGIMGLYRRIIDKPLLNQRLSYSFELLYNSAVPNPSTRIDLDDTRKEEVILDAKRHFLTTLAKYFSLMVANHIGLALSLDSSKVWQVATRDYLYENFTIRRINPNKVPDPYKQTFERFFNGGSGIWMRDFFMLRPSEYLRL